MAAEEDGVLKVTFTPADESPLKNSLYNFEPRNSLKYTNRSTADPNLGKVFKVIRDDPLTVRKGNHFNSQIIGQLHKGDIFHATTIRNRTVRVIWPIKGYVPEKRYKANEQYSASDYFVTKIDPTSTLPDDIFTFVEQLWESQQEESRMNLEGLALYINTVYSWIDDDKIQKVAEELMQTYGDGENLYWCSFLKSYEQSFETNEIKTMKELKRRGFDVETSRDLHSTSSHRSRHLTTETRSTRFRTQSQSTMSSTNKFSRHQTSPELRKGGNSTVSLAQAQSMKSDVSGSRSRSHRSRRFALDSKNSGEN